MALPAYQATGAGTRGTGKTVTPAMPAGIVAGDTLIAQVATEKSGETFSCATSGWNAGDSNNTGNMSGAWFWKDAVGSDGSPTITWGANATYEAQILRWNGSSNQSSPIGHTVNAFGNSQTGFSVGGITSSSANSLMVYWVATDGSALSITGGIDYTVRSNTGNNAISVGFVDGPVIISAATSNAYAISNLSTVGFNWVGFGFEILGSGGAGVANVRATQVFQEVLETYSDPKHVRATGVVMQVLLDVGGGVSGGGKSQGYIIA